MQDPGHLGKRLPHSARVIEPLWLDAELLRIEGVFETAAHSRFSHKSYLLIYTPSGRPNTKDFDRVERECERFGLGLITFQDPSDWESYETIQEAERRNPDPADVNDFISTQVGKQTQAKILELVK